MNATSDDTAITMGLPFMFHSLSMKMMKVFKMTMPMIMMTMIMITIIVIMMIRYKNTYILRHVL